MLCSGKVYVDLVSDDRREASNNTAIVRVEQLYPFPLEPLKLVLANYANLEQVIWIQEEPQNMGAWAFVQPRLAALINGRWPLHYLGRPRSSSPAEGSSAWHAATQKTLVAQAYTPDEDAGSKHIVWEKS
jgi:2-oxoglutarate dehydrogenase E1 component